MTPKNKSQKMEHVKGPLLNLITLGLPIVKACAGVGLSKETFYTWYMNGKKGKAKIYVDFYNDVERAKSLSVAKHLKTINLEAQTNWKAAAWLVSKLCPEFSDNNQINVGVDVSLNATEARKKIVSRIDGIATRFGTDEDSG